MGLTRSDVIRNLEHSKRWRVCPADDVLDYAIASLKTDEAYELEYEEREVIPAETIDKILHQLQASDGKEEYISVKKCEEIIERIMKEENLV